MKESEHQRDLANSYRDQYGAYDYRTKSAERAARDAQERERTDGESSWTYAGGGTSFGAPADGWTAIAGLLLVGLGLFVAYHVVLLIIEIYRLGVSPYFYLYEALTTRISPVVIGYGLLFSAAQIVPFLLFFRALDAGGTFLRIAVYIAVLPPMNVLLAYAGPRCFEFLAPTLDLRPILARASAGLPTDLRLVFGVDPEMVARAFPVGLAALVLFIAGFYLLWAILKCLTIAIVMSTRWLQRHFEQARHTMSGRILLVLLAVSFLVLCARFVRPPLIMPMAVQTFPVILIGMIYGWSLAGISVAGWLAAAALGLPVLANDAIGPRLMFGPFAGLVLGLILAGMLSGFRSAVPLFGHLLLIAVGANLLFVGAGFAWLSAWEGWDVRQIWQYVQPYLLGIALNSLVAATLFYAGERIAAACGTPAFQFQE
jgi:biotin transport system substrate-specific component